MFPRRLFHGLIIGVMIAFNVCLIACPVVHGDDGAGEEKKGVKVVRPGDVIDLRFTCFLKNGEVVASTDNLGETAKRSPLYDPFKVLSSSSLTVPQSERTCPSRGKAESLESEIQKRLLMKVVGKEEGVRHRIELESETAPAGGTSEGIVRVARIRMRPKVMRMPTGEYELRAGRKPEVGQNFAFDPAFPGRVESITDDEVVIRFSGRVNETIQTPFGKGKVREEEDHYKVEIDAKVGDLVRIGNRIGLIIQVGEKSMAIDYRHPFGFATLSCDVLVERIDRPELRKIEGLSTRSSIQGGEHETPSL